MLQCSSTLFALLLCLAAGAVQAEDVGGDDGGDYGDPVDEPGSRDTMCTSDMGCAPWQQCSVSLGECGSGLSPYDVCTGRCVAGQRLRVVVRAALRAWTERDPGTSRNPPQLAGGFEVVPPVLDGHLSLAGEIATGGTQARASARLTLTGWARPHPSFHLGPTLGWAGGRRGTGTLRLQYLPSVHLRGVTPLRFLSIGAEAGAMVADAGSTTAGTLRPFVALSLDLWSPPIPPR